MTSPAFMPTATVRALSPVRRYKLDLLAAIKPCSVKLWARQWVSSESNATLWKAFALKNVLLDERNISIKKSYRDGVGQHCFLLRIVLKKRCQVIRRALVQP